MQIYRAAGPVADVPPSPDGAKAKADAAALATLSVKELKARLKTSGVAPEAVAGCVEKGELVALLVQAGIGDGDQSKGNDQPSPPVSQNAPRVTKFLALDKCLPRRHFLQVVDFPQADGPLKISFDPEWLAIVR